MLELGLEFQQSTEIHLLDCLLYEVMIIIKVQVSICYLLQKQFLGNIINQRILAKSIYMYMYVLKILARLIYK